MCGIFLVLGRFSDAEGARMAQVAQQTQAHRGQDAYAHEILEIGAGWRLLMGHQRLSIIDLSVAGLQPMWSGSRRSAIVFNGEIFNYKELASSHALRLQTATDTEVLLELAERVSLTAALPLLNGMWGLGLVDTHTGKLSLARDRMGKKPLYWLRSASCLIAASELKTVARLAGRKFRVNTQVAGEYLSQALQDTSYVTWLDGIEHLPAASLITIDTNGENLSYQTQRMWEPSLATYQGSLQQAREEVRHVVDSAVSMRLRADVPIGITLSGGLDSSIIAACLSRSLPSGARLSALSAVSPGRAGDESIHIDRVCAEFDIDCRKVDLAWSPAETFALMKQVTWHNDAPLGSMSNIAFFRLMEEAKKNGIKVVLSGQGADEIFCGYRKYFYWAVSEQIRSGHIKSALSNVYGSVSSRTVLDQFSLSEAARYLPKLGFKRRSVLGSAINRDYKRLNVGIGNASVWARQLLDLQSLSVPYLTHYEDRASMAHGVEVRLPFLDYRVAELGISLPVAYKVQSGWTKYVLRKAYEDDLPNKTTWRRDKLGFTNPQEEWLRADLREELSALFKSNMMVYQFNLVERSAMLDMWKDFLERRSEVWHRDIFAVWALEVWLSEFSDFIEA